MKISTSIAVALALLSASASANSDQQPNAAWLQPVSVNKKASYNVTTPWKLDESYAERDIYIVELNDAPVVSYEGANPAYSATAHYFKNSGNTSVQRISGSSQSAVKAYRGFLQGKQQDVLAEIKGKVGKIAPVANYEYALNGFAIQATPEQAAAIAAMPQVSHVERDKIVYLDTDTGPILIGANKVWDGTAAPTLNALQGEGTVIAILDTGINTDHPSFAAVGGDGYAHTNPLGNGAFLGDCAASFPSLCNDKLIGVFSYPDIVNAYADSDVFTKNLQRNGEDYNGHGSHVAATAAGNVLFDVKERVPEADVNESDGIESGFVYDRVSGVAPHANIISYQVCLPGDEGDAYVGCINSAILAALDDVVASGIVDVVNFSVSGGDDPWSSNVNKAWLRVQQAGIFAAHSAGNDGPDDYSTDKYSPWYTVVGATTHGRFINYEKNLTDFSGGNFTPNPMIGTSNTGEITAPIVYAGNYPNSNDPNGDPAQCLEPYPEGTFQGEIVVCDRGDIARIQKAKNVAVGGAGGYVLANVPGGADDLANDVYIVPGIHISTSNAKELRQWLATGSGHMATITASEGGITIDPASADILASFSSRGPNSTISTLTPHLVAPGVNIFAAYSDEQYGHDQTGTAPSDYNYLSGTSMASPHVAGAGALIKQAHPSWTPDQIRSVLMMTATTAVTGEDGVSAANWFEMGAGRIRVDEAIRSSLTLDESRDNYLAANPATGGEPRSLNVPAFTDANCVGTCTLTRTVTAAEAGEWQVSLDVLTDDFDVSVSPSSFALDKGESQTLSVTMNTMAINGNEWAYANLLLTPASGVELHLPVAAFAANGTIPDELEITAHRNHDSYLLPNLLSVEITDFSYVSYGLIPASVVKGSLQGDSDNSDYLDDTSDGIFLQEVTVSEGDIRLVAQTSDVTAIDLDMYILYDKNNNGIPEEGEVVGESTSFTADEYINLRQPEAGRYWILLQNWKPSFASATDTFMLSYAVVDSSPDSSLVLQGPDTTAALAEFDVRLLWDLDDASPGDRFFGAFALGTDNDNPTNLGITSVDIIRGENDVYIDSPSSQRVSVGEISTFSVNVMSNYTSEDRRYAIDVILPDSVTVIPDSVGSGGTVNGNVISWTTLQPALERPTSAYYFTNSITDKTCAASTAISDALSQLSSGRDISAIDTVNSYATYRHPVRFLGNDYAGFTVTKDGYITFANTLGASPWTSQSLPSEVAPNAVIAANWRKTNVNDSSRIGVAGLSDGSAVISWQRMEDAATATELPDFSVWLNAKDNEDMPAVILHYANLTSPQALTGIFGFENAMGTAGLSVPVSELPSHKDLQVCFYPSEANTEAVANLSFNVRLNQDAATGPIEVYARSAVTNVPGTREETSAVYSGVQVEGAPTVSISGNSSITELRGQTYTATVSDPNDDEVNVSWSQVSGPTATLQNSNRPTVTLTAPEIENTATIVLQATATDAMGNTASAQINITVNDRPSSSGGGGAFGWLMLLIIPCLMQRRRSH
ncbi:S8 family serine peptidase [Alteromonas pelagimontana]|uniref:S8 family serine peptidase n=1 Tax=Alteromonas pelagimontana TaxID=1858656 RepID=A0A6M4MJ16_9ALTE|nr:S8 family serine peptidase [Alteromonas pelagimontana]QJR82590.1 S8 family serine peptidase [Alteromonas pelagimontana]